MRTVLGFFCFVVICSSCSRTAPTPDGLFERKEKCATYFDQFKKDLLADDRSPFTSSYLTEIFYSPSLETCIAAFHTDYENIPGGADIAYMLQDVLSREILFDLKTKADSSARTKVEGKT